MLRRENWFVGVVDTSMLSKKGLPIFCCRVIWCKDEGREEEGKEREMNGVGRCRRRCTGARREERRKRYGEDRLEAGITMISAADWFRRGRDGCQQDAWVISHRTTAKELEKRKIERKRSLTTTDKSIIYH